MSSEEKENTKLAFTKDRGGAVEVKGNRRIIVQDDNNPDALEAESAAVISDSTETTFIQHSARGAIRLTGDKISKNSIIQGDGNDRLLMKDGPGITENHFNGGLKNQGIGYRLFRLADGIGHALGSTSLRTDHDTIVLEGKPEDYKFTFHKDANPSLGNYTGSFDIEHRPSGAKNTFQNYEYAVFGGDLSATVRSNYVEISKIKAEEEAKAAVNKTRGQITSVSENVPQKLPSAKGNEPHL